MRMRLRRLLPVAILLGAVGLTAALISARPAPPRNETAPLAPLVEVQPAQPFEGAFVLTTQGTVSPRTQTVLVSEVNGAIVETVDRFNAGGFLRKGDVLLRIDPKDYQAALKRAEAQVANRQALLAQEQARAEQARKDWENLRRPGEPSDLVLRVPYVAEAEANLRSAQADLQQARVNLERTVIRAPFDGLLREKRVDLGQYVAIGSQLAVLYAVDRAEVRLPLTEADSQFVQLPAAGTGDADGAPVVLRATIAGTSHTWPARLVRSEGVIDERSRVIHAVVAVEDPYGLSGREGPALPFGTFVQAEIPARVDHQVVGVPRHALRGGNQLMVVGEDGKLHLRDVHVVRGDAQQIFVDTGLQPDERVIVSALDAPVEGMAVRIAGEEEPEAVADAAGATAPAGTGEAQPATDGDAVARSH
jgi:RND family efflux transporter MFP subunit